MEQTIPRVVGRVGEGTHRRIHTYEKGRHCAHNGCPQPLSVYNPGPYCYSHSTLAGALRLPACAPEEDMMARKDEIRRLLEEAVPGEWVLRPEGVTTGSWGAVIHDLRHKDGLSIESRAPAHGGGYRLTQSEVEPAPEQIHQVEAQQTAETPQGSARDEELARAEVQAQEERDTVIARIQAARQSLEGQVFTELISTEEDPEVAAIRTIADSLVGLDDRARRRVIEWAFDRFVEPAGPF